MPKSSRKPRLNPRRPILIEWATKEKHDQVEDHHPVEDRSPAIQVPDFAILPLKASSKPYVRPDSLICEPSLWQWSLDDQEDDYDLDEEDERLAGRLGMAETEFELAVLAVTRLQAEASVARRAHSQRARGESKGETPSPTEGDPSRISPVHQAAVAKVNLFQYEVIRAHLSTKVRESYFLISISSYNLALF